MPDVDISQTDNEAENATASRKSSLLGSSLGQGRFISMLHARRGILDGRECGSLVK